MSLNSRGGLLEDVRLDVAAAVLGLVLAVAMVPLRLVASQVFIETLPIALGVACLLYIHAARHEGAAGAAYLSGTVARLLPSLTVLGMALMVAAAATTGRSVLFFGIAALVGTLIFGQILLSSEEDFHGGLLLFEVVLYALVLRFAALYVTPGYIGIDVWTHVPNWSQKILDAHSLSPIADEKYYASPLFHLLVVSTSMLLDVPLREATILSAGLAMPLSVLLVYATTRIFASPRWAVFATAAFAVSGSVIEWGLALIPTSLGLVFFLAILYCLTLILYTDYGTADFALVVFFSVAVILTHQVSSFIMLVFVGSSLLAKLLLRLGFLRPESSSAIYFSPQDTVNVTGLLVFDLGLITFMWSLTPSYGDSSFLETMFAFFYDTLVNSEGFLDLASSGGDASQSVAASPTLMGEVVKHLEVTGFLLLLTFTMVGSLYLLRRRNVSHAGFTFILSVVAMFVFVFGFPLFGVRTFIPARWFAFLAAPMAVLAAIGIGYLSENATPGLVLAILLVFTISFPAVSIVTDDASQDRPVFDAHQTRYAYTEPELAAVETIGAITPGVEPPLNTDHPYGTVFERTEAQDSEPIMLVDGAPANETLVYRSYQGSGATFFVDGNDVPHQPSVTREQICGSRDVTYTNGEVQLCVAPGA